MDPSNQIDIIAKDCSSFLPEEGLKEVQHYIDHGEPAMAFEGLLLELMKIDKVPVSYNYSEWANLIHVLGLDTDSVFDGHLWQKFQEWGRNKMPSKN